MSIERFAKIIETSTHQVLFYIEYNDENDLYDVHQIMKIDIGMVDAKFGFQEEKKACAYLESLDAEAADKVVNGVLEILDNGQ